MVKKYEMLADSKIRPSVKKGDIVYDNAKYDYGLANDDIRATGVRHISVTEKEDGDYPFFTVPVSALREVK